MGIQQIGAETIKKGAQAAKETLVSETERMGKAALHNTGKDIPDFAHQAAAPTAKSVFTVVADFLRNLPSFIGSFFRAILGEGESAAASATKDAASNVASAVVDTAKDDEIAVLKKQLAEANAAKAAKSEASEATSSAASHEAESFAEEETGNIILKAFAPEVQAHAQAATELAEKLNMSQDDASRLIQLASLKDARISEYSSQIANAAKFEYDETLKSIQEIKANWHLKGKPNAIEREIKSALARQDEILTELLQDKVQTRSVLRSKAIDIVKETYGDINPAEVPASKIEEYLNLCEKTEPLTPAETRTKANLEGLLKQNRIQPSELTQQVKTFEDKLEQQLNATAAEEVDEELLETLQDQAIKRFTKSTQNELAVLSNKGTIATSIRDDFRSNVATLVELTEKKAKAENGILSPSDQRLLGEVTNDVNEALAKVTKKGQTAQTADKLLAEINQDVQDQLKLEQDFLKGASTSAPVLEPDALAAVAGKFSEALSGGVNGVHISPEDLTEFVKLSGDTPRQNKGEIADTQLLKKVGTLIQQAGYHPEQVVSKINANVQEVLTRAQPKAS